MELDAAYSDAPSLADAQMPPPADVCLAFADLVASRDAPAPLLELDKDLSGAMALGDAYRGASERRQATQATIDRLLAQLQRVEQLSHSIATSRAELWCITGNDATDAQVARWTEETSAAVEAARAEADALDHRLAQLRGAVSSVLRGVVDPERVDKKLCPVCFDREVDTCCVPCGHTVCTRCSSRMPQRAPCPTCRAQVCERIRVYFSV